ncbi:ATP-binding protein [uncultured Fibrobacter sp.]|uniref:ATP-binding protein n=1 Tax=uncultured Fibrobacter sp. TaxID=261512 RepID=UPI002805E5F4|nr:ATP-binding protein [uncultured Fibrobacter sp.]
MYRKRHAEETVKKLSQMFGAVLVAGPRQVGKTTMLKTLTQNIGYVTLDDIIVRTAAREQSSTFFKDNPPPVFVDEIQKAPELFEQVKMYIDRDRKKGQFYMCGSQQFAMMKGVSESLSGRIGLLTLLGYSLREIYDIDFNMPFIPTEEYFTARKSCLKNVDYDDVWKIIWRGSMPELFENSDYDWQMFYGAYLRTYIERDVKDLTEIGDTVKFSKFMIAVAAMTGNILNKASLARDVGISEPTAERWLSILVASNIVFLLQPYANNITKRAIKTPKAYFLDTGLAAYLTKWNTSDVLKNGAMAGAFFESFVVSEIIKSHYNKGILEPPIYFYRDKEMNEIDLLIENAGTLHPIEIKKHADPAKKDMEAFAVLDKIGGVKRGAGGVICLYDNLVTLNGNDRCIPIQYV